MVRLYQCHPHDSEEIIEVLAEAGIEVEIINRMGSLGFMGLRTGLVDIGVAPENLKEARKHLHHYLQNRHKEVRSHTRGFGWRVLISVLASIVATAIYALNAEPFPDHVIGLLGTAGGTFFITLLLLEYLFADRSVPPPPEEPNPPESPQR